MRIDTTEFKRAVAKMAPFEKDERLILSSSGQDLNIRLLKSDLIIDTLVPGFGSRCEIDPVLVEAAVLKETASRLGRRKAMVEVTVDDRLNLRTDHSFSLHVKLEEPRDDELVDWFEASQGDMKAEGTLGWTADQFAALFPTLILATTTERAKYTLGCILIQNRKNEATLTASDGRRLSRWSIATTEKREINRMLPAVTTARIGLAAKSSRESVFMDFFSGGMVIATIGLTRLRFKVEPNPAEFPPHEHLVEKFSQPPLWVARIDRERTISAVRQTMPRRKASYVLKLSHETERELLRGVVESDATSESAEIEIPSHCEGTFEQVACNPAMLVGVLGCLEASEVTLQQTEEDGPVIVTMEGHRFIHALMPMMVKDQAAEGSEEEEAA